jgi:hypothetical protein
VDRARLWLDEPSRDAQQRTFAAVCWPNQCGRSLGADGERHTFENVAFIGTQPNIVNH